MIESPLSQPISKRILDLCCSHDSQATYRANRLYVGSSEYEELRRYAGDFLQAPPLLKNYEQGTFQIFGKAIFVLKDIDSHLALA
jgi:hypothetical protein